MLGDRDGAVESHLQTCIACRDYGRDVALVEERLRKAIEPPPEALWERIRPRRLPVQRPNPAWRSRSALAGLGAVAAAAAAMLGGLWLARPEPAASPSPVPISSVRRGVAPPAASTTDGPIADIDGALLRAREEVDWMERDMRRF